MEEKSTALTQENILYREKHRIRLKPFWKARLSRIIERFLSCTGMTKLPVHQLEALLRRWDLEPIILDQQASGGQTIIEKLEEYGSNVGYAIVLATPDDDGKAKSETAYKSRVRQNVVLELGMFLAKLGRERVAILLKEAADFEKPSDIQGLVYIPFQNKVDEVALSLIRELSRQGYKIDTTRI